MPIIYPTTYDIDIIKTHSEAEYKIFKAIEELDPVKTRDWVIYYSYSFKKREDKNYNFITIEDNGKKYFEKNFFEIDFLILVPNIGIFVFEIKGGKIKHVSGNGFVSIDKKGIEHDIKPFIQAKNNYYTLNNVLGKMKLGSESVMMSQFISSTLVGFPDIDVIPRGNYNSNGHDVYVSGMDLYDFIMNASSYLKKTYPNKMMPSNELINIIVKKLNGSDFEYTKDKKIYIDSVNLSLNDLTEEQETVFKGLMDNKRCLIRGKAGTGKTVLCEFLYKHFSEEKKYSVIYFTYNRLIAQKLNKDLTISKNCKCYPIIDYLEEVYKKITGDENLSFKNYEEKKEFLFAAIAEQLDNNIELIKYDCVIIDEAQDIDLNDSTIKFLNNILNKGLKNGFCYLFYDANQTIFNKQIAKIYESDLFGDDYYRYAKYALIRNCRNGQGVRHSMNSLVEYKENFNNLALSHNTLENEDVKYIEVKQSYNGAKLIERIINELIEKGVDKKQITLLFNLRSNNEDNIIFKELSNMLELFEYNGSKIKGITYSTVSSFKGLENDVIIYINDNDYSKTFDHYVAISRAKVYAYICKVIK